MALTMNGVKNAMRKFQIQFDAEEIPIAAARYRVGNISPTTAQTITSWTRYLAAPLDLRLTMTADHDWLDDQAGADMHHYVSVRTITDLERL